MRLKIHQVDLRLTKPFRISRDVYDSRESVIVELASGALCGYGEACAHRYYGITRKALVDDLRSVRALLADVEPGYPPDIYSELRTRIWPNRFALSALDVALWDLYGKLNSEPVSRQVTPGPIITDQPYTAYTLGIDTLPAMLDDMARHPFDSYKVKMGFDGDVEILKQLTDQSPAKFVVDANCAWDLASAQRKIQQLADLGVLWVEQPLAAGSPGDMRALKEVSPLPLIADESFLDREDFEKISSGFHGVNIKLMKCGGLTPALEMIREARSLGLLVLIGCMVETSIGISAGAQLAAFADYLDLDGFLHLRNDPAQGVVVENGGLLKLSDTPGIGLTAVDFT